jgi:uncharacterized repeat protein (TIGR03803 family)
MKTLRLLVFTAAIATSLFTTGAAGQTSFTILYTFDTPANGQGPTGIFSANGTLYGTTVDGGAYGKGTVFELQPPADPGGTWTETVLYSFTGQNGDGANPSASPVVGAHGVLYGTTDAGGSSQVGTVFELQPPAAPGATWTETVLHSFNEFVDGITPSASLVVGPDGSLYGTTLNYGYNGDGTVFELQPPSPGGTDPGATWSATVLYTFTGGDDGGFPAGLTLGADGALYGAAFQGGASGAGTIFQLSPPDTPGGTWAETVLHSFTGGDDGVCPAASPVVTSDGTIYGSTTGVDVEFGGYPGVVGQAAVFKLTPPAGMPPESGGNWVKTVLADFGESLAGGPGPHPDSTLIVRESAIYVAASTLSGGEVFELRKPAEQGGRWTKIVLHSFTDGSRPAGTLVMDKSGAFYGVTVRTRRGGAGTVYQIKP